MSRYVTPDGDAAGKDSLYGQPGNFNFGISAEEGAYSSLTTPRYALVVQAPRVESPSNSQLLREASALISSKAALGVTASDSSPPESPPEQKAFMLLFTVQHARRVHVALGQLRCVWRWRLGAGASKAENEKAAASLWGEVLRQDTVRLTLTALDDLSNAKHELATLTVARQASHRTAWGILRHLNRHAVQLGIVRCISTWRGRWLERRLDPRPEVAAWRRQRVSLHEEEDLELLELYRALSQQTQASPALARRGGDPRWVSGISGVSGVMLASRGASRAARPAARRGGSARTPSLQQPGGEGSWLDAADLDEIEYRLPPRSGENHAVTPALPKRWVTTGRVAEDSYKSPAQSQEETTSERRSSEREGAAPAVGVLREKLAEVEASAMRLDAAAKRRVTLRPALPKKLNAAGRGRRKSLGSVNSLGPKPQLGNQSRDPKQATSSRELGNCGSQSRKPSLGIRAPVEASKQKPKAAAALFPGNRTEAVTALLRKRAGRGAG